MGGMSTHFGGIGAPGDGVSRRGPPGGVSGAMYQTGGSQVPADASGGLMPMELYR